jgi:hypothetical protein
MDRAASVYSQGDLEAALSAYEAVERLGKEDEISGVATDARFSCWDDLEQALTDIDDVEKGIFYTVGHQESARVFSLRRALAGVPGVAALPQCVPAVRGDQLRRRSVSQPQRAGGKDCHASGNE